MRLKRHLVLQFCIFVSPMTFGAMSVIVFEILVIPKCALVVLRALCMLHVCIHSRNVTCHILLRYIICELLLVID